MKTVYQLTAEMDKAAAEGNWALHEELSDQRRIAEVTADEAILEGLLEYDPQELSHAYPGDCRA